MGDFLKIAELLKYQRDIMIRDGKRWPHFIIRIIGTRITEGVQYYIVHVGIPWTNRIVYLGSDKDDEDDAFNDIYSRVDRLFAGYINQHPMPRAEPWWHPQRLA